MAEGRWRHTAAILTQQVNMNRKEGVAPITADKLNPYASSKKTAKPNSTDGLPAKDALRAIAGALGAKFDVLHLSGK